MKGRPVAVQPGVITPVNKHYRMIMGFFDQFKEAMGDGSGQLSQHWNVLEQTADVDRLLKAGGGTHVIYKHSPICPISTQARGRVEKRLEELSGKAELHFIDVVNSRPLSDYLAEQSGVTHQSPQILVLRDGQVISSASHGDVSAELIDSALQETG